MKLVRLGKSKKSDLREFKGTFKVINRKRDDAKHSFSARPGAKGVDAKKSDDKVSDKILKLIEPLIFALSDMHGTGVPKNIDKEVIASIQQLQKLKVAVKTI